MFLHFMQYYFQVFLSKVGLEYIHMIRKTNKQTNKDSKLAAWK